MDEGAAVFKAHHIEASSIQPILVVHADAPMAVVEFVTARVREVLARSESSAGPSPGHKELAEEIKRALENAFSGLWHVIVGVAFGLSVTHETHALLLLRAGQTHVLAFQSLDDSAALRNGAGAALLVQQPPGTTMGGPSRRGGDDEDE